MIILRHLLFVLLLVAPLLVGAQKKKKLSKSEKMALELYEREFGTSNEIFEIASIPDKYASESSIVIAKKVYVVFGKNKKGKSAFQIASRNRILLNDQAAVNDYSEFYYQKSDIIRITIIKPSGSESEIDLDNAVEVNTDIPKQYRDRYQRDDYFKVAIPNLEVGDIVDFFKVFREPESSQREFIIPVDSYRPIIHQKLTIDVDKYWTLYYGTSNGAPDFQIDARGGFDMKGKQRDKVKRLRFEYKNAESKEWERWASVDDDGPVIKLLAAPIRSPLHQKVILVNELNSVDYIARSIKGVKDVTKLIEKNLKSYLKELKLKDMDESDAAEVIYRALRIILMRSMVETESIDLTVISRAISRQGSGISDAVFSSIFAKFLNQSKISADIVLARSRSAKEDDFLVGQELTLGVYVPKLDKYYWPFTSFSRPGEIPYYLEGLEVIGIPYPKVFKKEASQYVTSSVLPSSSITENTYSILATADITEDNLLKYKSTTDLTGYFREVYAPLFLFNTDYLSEDMTYAEVNRYFSRFLMGYFGSNSTYDRSQEEYEEYEKIKNERLKSWLESEHASLELTNFAVTEYGMMNKEKRLTVSYEFTSDGLVKKAGPNLIFDIGKVSGDQLQLDREELEGRRSNVKIECPKSISTEITINLPEGLIANGLKDLNMKIENEIGLFECTAMQEGNTIKMNTTKEYRVDAFEADKWPLMVEFIEAAYEQSQKKVILK